MNTAPLFITEAQLAGLVGGLGYPNPDDDTPIWRWPHGPGPVAKSWMDLLSRVALNPQPLPPKKEFATLIARAVLERADQVGDLSSMLPGQARALSGTFANTLAEFGEDCGTMGRWELLQKLLDWLKHHPHPHPDPQPDPWWLSKLSQNEIIIIGGSIAFAGERFVDKALRGALEDVGGKLMRNSLKSGQGVDNGLTVPAVEHV